MSATVLVDFGKLYEDPSVHVQVCFFLHAPNELTIAIIAKNASTFFILPDF